MPHLRQINLSTVVSTSAGLTFASSCFVALVQIAGYMAGDWAWLAILISGALCLLSAACFAELNGLLPSAAGLRLYLSRAFNDQVAITVSLLYMAVVTAVIGTESYVLSHVLNYTFPQIPALWWITIMLVIAMGLNIRGIKLAGRFQDVVTYGLVISLLIMAVFAIRHNGIHIQLPARLGNPNGIINAVAVGVFLFVGFEWVTPLAEEVTDNRHISRGMLLAIGLLSITYAFFALALTSTVPAGELQGSPIPQLVFANRILGSFGAGWMVILSLAASITTFNAGLITVSRFMYACSRENILPRGLSKISLRYATPWVALITLFVIGLAISIIVYATQRYLTLVNLAAVMESIVYILAALAVIVLRRKNPTGSRVFRAGKGLFVPVLTVLVFTFLAVAVIISQKIVGIYLLILLAICAAYVKLVVPHLKQRAAVLRTGSNRRRAQEAAKGQAAREK